jgi:hypothetical protein
VEVLERRYSPVHRVTDLNVADFVSEYVEQNRPVIVTGAMHAWPAMHSWDPVHFATRFGAERVQIYGDLFKLTAIDSLSNYFQKYFGRDPDADRKAAASSPYIRWYCHLSSDERVPWADEVFTHLADDWARPSFFPCDSFALPICGQGDSIDPSRDWFPARGLFISARGARTRLHADPWCSDAILCQVYGRKDFVMYHPSQAPYLSNGNKTVDIEAPDLEVFPGFLQAEVAVRDSLEPGECLLVPAGWHHHFNSTTDSISLTWNFVHRSRLQPFLAYLSAGPQENELKQLAYAYFESPDRRPLSRQDPVAASIDARLKRLLKKES